MEFEGSGFSSEANRAVANDFSKLAENFARAPLSDILHWVWREFGLRAAVGTSFQGAGIVILHEAVSLGMPIPAFTLDTGLLFPETLALKAQLESRLGIVIETIRPTLTVGEQAAEHGPALWSRAPDACCALRKVAPLERKLASLDAWITGVRRQQADTRSHTTVIERYGLGGTGRRFIFKVNPLAHWTREEVQAYLRRHDLPQNPLLARGFRSIGCQPCTRAVSSLAADERAGRWVGSAKTECGIHTFLGENI